MAVGVAEIRISVTDGIEREVTLKEIFLETPES
jgi:hypothetical protein